MGLTNTGAGVKQGGAHFVKRIVFTKYAIVQPNPYITITDEGGRIDMDRAELSTALTDVMQNTGMWYVEFSPLHTSEHGHSIVLRHYLRYAIKTMHKMAPCVTTPFYLTVRSCAAAV
jgi:hypothetical protein